jgi:predicted secreted Zn-dependent protease
MLAGCTTGGLSTVYYNVPGTTVEQISEQIARRGPQSGHAIGTSETRMTPHITTTYSDGQCRIVSAEIKLDIKVTLPRWTELDKADQRTRNSFQGLSEHVEWHEQQHVRISRQYARLLEEKLLAMKPESSCRLILRKAREIFRQGFEDHNRAQLAFDDEERPAIEKRLSSL